MFASFSSKLPHANPRFSSRKEKLGKRTDKQNISALIKLFGLFGEPLPREPPLFFRKRKGLAKEIVKIKKTIFQKFFVNFFTKKLGKEKRLQRTRRHKRNSAAQLLKACIFTLFVFEVL